MTVTGVAAGNVGADVSGNVGTDVTGSYGMLHVDANGSYTYTLTTPFDTAPDADNGANTETGKDVFTFTVTDCSRQHLDLDDHDRHRRRQADGGERYRRGHGQRCSFDRRGRKRHLRR